MSIAWMSSKGFHYTAPRFSPDRCQKCSDKLVCLDLLLAFASGFAAGNTDE